MMEIMVLPLTLHPVNLVQIIYITVCVMGLMIVSYNPRINCLRILLFLVALLMTCNVLEETNPYRDSYLITPIFTLGLGPAFYWFCAQLVYNKIPEFRHIAVHLSPMLLALPFTHWPQAIIAFGSLSQALYLIFALRLIKRYHQVVRHTNSNPEDFSIHWVIGIFVVFLVMMLQDLVRLNLQPFLDVATLRIWYFANTSIYTGLIAYLIAMALRQQHFFTVSAEVETLIDEPPTDNVDENSRSLFLEIDSITRARKLYLQPRFSLRDLATETGIQEKTLSWAINQGARKNFSDYINQLRIEEACQRLATKGDGNLLEMAFAAGFNSKSTFNAAFKKQTGLTPRQFRDTLTSG